MISNFKSLYSFVLFFLFSGCIDPLNVEISDAGGRLVVFGEITNEVKPYTVELSRSVELDDYHNIRVSEAKVEVIDESGSVHKFDEYEPGVYKSCPSDFIAEINKKYYLRIETSDGTIYESDLEPLESTAKVDSVYYKKAEKEINQNGQLKLVKGVEVFCDFQDGLDKDFYYVDWEGTYKFKASFYDENNLYCYNTEYPVYDINLYDDRFANNQVFENYLITFLEDGLRFTEDYRFTVKVKTIDENGYGFWKVVKEQYESDGSIFSAIPSQLKSNLKCVTSPEKDVLGYFFVSGLDSKRIKIPADALLGINEARLRCDRFRATDPLPEYCYDCTKYKNSTNQEPSYW